MDLQPVGTRRSYRLALVATALFPIGLASLVAFAWFSGEHTSVVTHATTSPEPSSAAARTPNPSPAIASLPPTRRSRPQLPAVPTPDVAASPERLAMAEAGYEVADDPSAIGPPIALPDSQVIVFRSGGWLAPDGVVAVGVGTPAHAARTFGSDTAVRVYGASLSELERDFRSRSPDRVVSATSITVAGVPARLLGVESFPPEIRSVVLVVRDGRSYVIAAWGFSSLYPGDLTHATQAGLADFLRRFHFLASTASAGTISGHLSPLVR